MYRVLFDTGPARKAAGLPDRYEVLVGYSSHDGTEYEDEQIIDLGPFWGAPDIRDHDLHDIDASLDQIEKDLKAIGDAIKSLRPPKQP